MTTSTPMCPDCAKGDSPLCKPCRLLAWGDVWDKIDAHGCETDDVSRCDECDAAVWAKWLEINLDDDRRRAKMHAQWNQMEQQIAELERRYSPPEDPQ